MARTTYPTPDGTVKAYLGLADRTRVDIDDFVFWLNPDRVRRRHVPTYAMAQVSGGNFGLGSGPSSPSPVEWVRNAPEEIDIHFMLAADGNDDVDDELLLLDRYGQKRAPLGEPPQLIFVMGPRSDRVVIKNKDIDEKTHHPDLRGKIAEVSLVFTVIRLRSR